jgi:hypothetical protein
MPAPASANPFDAMLAPVSANPFAEMPAPASANPFDVMPAPASANPFDVMPAPASANPFDVIPASASANPFDTPPTKVSDSNPSLLARFGTAAKQVVKSATSISAVSEALAAGSVHPDQSKLVAQFVRAPVSEQTTQDITSAQRLATQNDTDKSVLEQQHLITSADKVSWFGNTAGDRCRDGNQPNSAHPHLSSPT